MPSFKNLDGIYNALAPQILASINDAMAEQCKDIIRDYIETKIYSVEPNVYQRTYELLNSLRIETSMVNGKPGVEIFIDDDELHGGDTAWYNAPQLGITKGDRLSLAEVAKAVETRASNPVSSDTEFWKVSIDHLKGVNFFINDLIKDLKNKGIVIK